MKIQVNDEHHLHVRVIGEEGPVTILLHGWVVSGEVWEPVVQRWPADAGRLVIPDQRGTGWSAKPGAGGYAIEEYAADVIAIIDHLKLEDVMLVGHSLGGAVAQRVAIDRPKALRKLVLLCAVPASGAALTDEQIAYFHSLGGSHEGTVQVIRMTMAKEAAHPADFARLIAATSATSLTTFLESFDTWRTANFADELPNITTPTVVLSGGGDQILPTAHLQATIADLIPGAVLEELPEVGHYPQLEDPEYLTQRLAALAK